MNVSPVFSMGDLMQACRCSRSKVVAMAKRLGIEPARTVGGQFRFTRSQAWEILRAIEDPRTQMIQEEEK